MSDNTNFSTPDVITVPSDKKPTLLNASAANGALVGAVLGAGGGRAMQALAAVTGGAIGGQLEKSQTEHEFYEGRKVAKPYSKALDVTLGALSGAATGILLGALAVSMGGLIGVAASIAVIGGAIGGVLLGGFAGEKGFNKRAHEYKEAQYYFIEHGGHYRGRVQETQQSQAVGGVGVSPEETAMLHQRLSALEAKSHEDKITAAANGPQVIATQR